MKRFKNILYFADGATEPSSALRRAANLASANEARLTVIDVVPESESRRDIADRFDLDIQRVLREDRETQLYELIAGLRGSGPAADARVVAGTPFIEVIRAVQDEGYDLLMKDARPPDSFAKRTLGTTDLHLLRKCPCPIWIDRPEAASPYRTVLAAVDLPEAGQEDSSRLILDLATSLAEREGAALAIVHAWGLQGESLLRSDKVGIPGVELERLLVEKRERQRARLGTLLDDYGISPHDPLVHLVKGDPAPSIRTVSQELDADLIVMGTLVRSGVPGLFIGSTAEDLLQTTQASVLAIKPYGFVSPVTAGHP
jgi:nucleotide-binding universal stress UspA family protein